MLLVQNYLLTIFVCSTERPREMQGMVYCQGFCPSEKTKKLPRTIASKAGSVKGNDL